jgi:hypothetical protein
MQVSIKTHKGETIDVLVRPSDTILHVKQQIEEREGTPSDEQILTFNSTELADDRRLSDYNILKWSVLHMKRRHGSM